MKADLCLESGIAAPDSLIEVILCLIEIILSDAVARILCKKLLTRNQAQEDGNDHQYMYCIFSFHTFYILKFKPMLNVRDKG